MKGGTMPKAKTLSNVIAQYLKNDIPLSEMRDAYEFLRFRVKNAQKQKDAEAMGAFSIGDLVVVTEERGSRKLPAGIVGKIERFGLKNVSVDFGAYRKWRVPASWLEFAPAGSTFAGSNVRLPRPRRQKFYEETPPHLA